MTKAKAATTAAREQLVEDMKAVISDAEELLRATAGAAGERVSSARARAEETIRAAKDKLSGFEDAMMDRAKEVAKSADDYVHENPWGAVGVAAVVGLVAGVMISRR